IGHAIEAASNFRIRHGIAVAKGIAFETYLVWSMGFITKQQLDKTFSLLNLYGYNLEINRNIRKFTKIDKKVKNKKICICVPVWKISS
ncbi:MAG: hypothetical protein HY606_14995, partial [Planctomycetes bacterium]|nr:hypothetical protein [Planctomycetota bacterium]